MTVIVVTGLPGTGKTTIATALDDRMDRSVVISSDRIRQQLFAHYMNSDQAQIYTKKHKEIVYNGILLLIQHLLPLHDHIILDATYHLRSRRQRLIDAVATEMETKSDHTSGSADIVFVVTQADDDTVRERMNARQEDTTASDARFQQYLDLREQWQPLDTASRFSKICKISTEKTVDDSISQVMSCLKSEESKE